MTISKKKYQFYVESIFNIKKVEEFHSIALELFHDQYRSNSIYREFARLNNRSPENVKSPEDIPFLPVTLFKYHEIVSCRPYGDRAIKFISSGTTGSIPSVHLMTDISLYERSFTTCFEHFFGDITRYDIFALLPSYYENKSSSLIYMIDKLIRSTGSEAGGFYNRDHVSLQADLEASEKSGRKSILIGVSFALLDIAKDLKKEYPNIIIIETGGMKGRRKEMVREELHSSLKASFGVEKIVSEYGMTELSSQAWAIDKGVFYTPPWMNIVVTEINDPFSCIATGKTGLINIIDLANINSCAFIATQDLGRKALDGGFEVLGRSDDSEQRGCNLIYL